jgi:hypothetical protein|tara:strand:- start:81 stop:491 length:411 start_codon:yes stop_codon:yes gene_type:complete
MGGASAPPLCFLLLLNKKTFYKMGHFDKIDATRVGVAAIKDGAGVASVAATTAGDGTCTISGTDLAGSLTFANTWADGDTAVVTFGTAKEAAPLVLICGGAGANVDVDTLAVTTAGFTLTAGGTCAGDLQYLVIEK